MFDPAQHVQAGDGLLIVDLQWDFCPGGLLPVPEGDRIVSVVNQWTETALKKSLPVYFSRDWHPVRHISFKERGGDWPPHCIQDTDGAQFHPNLHVDRRILVITKGVRLDKDQNSVFDDTGFAHQLGHDGVKRLWVGGLAQDVCVRLSVLDARRAGLEVGVIQAATLPIDAESGRRAIEEMIKAGASII